MVLRQKASPVRSVPISSPTFACRKSWINHWMSESRLTRNSYLRAVTYFFTSSRIAGLCGFLAAMTTVPELSLMTGIHRYVESESVLRFARSSGGMGRRSSYSMERHS